MSTQPSEYSFNDENLILDMINFDFVPNGLVSGLSTAELNQLTADTSMKTLEQNSCQYPEIPIEEFSQLSSEVTSELYPQLSSEIKDELNQTEMMQKPKSSVSQTMQYSKKFKNFLLSKNLPDNIETMPEAILADYLRFFYHNLQKASGDFYCPSTLVCIRAAIHRYLTQAPNNRCVNIIDGPAFMSANTMLKTKVGQYLRSGAEPRKQTIEIEPKDLSILSSYFDRSTPTRLQQEIWYNIEYNFGMRGRENMRYLNVHTFVTEEDSSGRTYIRINETQLSKNVKASLSCKEYEDLKKAKMYERKDNEKHCPVAAFRLYVSLLPDQGNFWPRPKSDEVVGCSGAWYHPKLVLGKNALGKMMNNISTQSGLSRTYSNHCVRATVINQLHDQGFTKEQICKVTGHKNAGSIDSYIRKRCSDDEMYKLNQCLYKSLHQNDLQSSAEASCNSFIQKSRTTIESHDEIRTSSVEICQNVAIHGPAEKKARVVFKGNENIIEFHFE